jgi:16S rRNA (guanine966-N2)-methyltransferase
MVREAVFASLEARVGIAGAVVVDLYCGSGAMGIEALSRGASSCTFVDDDPACLTAARRNLEAVGLAERAATFVRSTLPGRAPPAHFDVAFCDPPYGDVDVAALVDGLDADVVVLETDRAIAVPEGWEMSVGRRYGGTLISMLTPTSAGVGE